MGDAPLAFVETAGGVRVSEDDLIVAGKNDVSASKFRWIGMADPCPGLFTDG
jgi:hypothetical protein